MGRGRRRKEKEGLKKKRRRRREMNKEKDYKRTEQRPRRHRGGALMAAPLQLPLKGP